MQQAVLKFASVREYRFVGKTHRTRWRKVPADGIMKPSRIATKKLGQGFSLEMRGAVLKRGQG